MQYKDDVHEDKKKQDKEKMICFCKILFNMTRYSYNKVLSSAPEFPCISKTNENTIQTWPWGQNLLQGFFFHCTVIYLTNVPQKSILFQHSFYTWQNRVNVHSQVLFVAYHQFKYSSPVAYNHFKLCYSYIKPDKTFWQVVNSLESVLRSFQIQIFTGKNGGIQFYTFASYALPCKMPPVVWQQNVTEY